MSFTDKFYPVETHPRSLDIVWCKFPSNENPKRPGPKSRPALVRSVVLAASHTQAWVEVVYGTSRATKQSHPNDLHIVKSAEIDKCGLLKVTCFVLDRTALLPWSPEYFVKRPDDGVGPIVGHLSEDRRQRLETLKRRRAETAKRSAKINA